MEGSSRHFSNIEFHSTVEKKGRSKVVQKMRQIILNHLGRGHFK